MTKRKELSPREREEKLRRKLKRTPEINPESVRNRKYIVTAHHGLRSFILYHGNNINEAKQICWLHTYVPRKRNGKSTGCPKTVKVWEVRQVRTQELED